MTGPFPRGAGQYKDADMELFKDSYLLPISLSRSKGKKIPKYKFGDIVLVLSAVVRFLDHNRLG